MPKKSRSKLFKQKRIPLLGELVDSVFTAMPALSLLSFVSTMVILYEVTKGYFIDILPWLTIFHFFGFVVIAFLPILLIVFKYVLPSIWHFRSTQMGHLESKLNLIAGKLDQLLGEKVKEDKSEDSSSS